MSTQTCDGCGAICEQHEQYPKKDGDGDTLIYCIQCAAVYNVGYRAGKEGE